MKSELFDVVSGVIQGGKLSPILFNIYIREIISVISYSKPFKYADDTVLLKLIYDKSDNVLLQTDLDAVQKWSDKKCLKLNASKSVHMRFSLKNSVEFPLYQINRQSIPLQQNHKHLGVFIDNMLTFNDHVEQVYTSCIRKWTTLKRLCVFASPAILTQLFKVYILPLVEYCNITWVPNEQQSKRLECIQKQITKFICNRTNLCHLSYSQKLLELDLKPLKVRRDLKILKYVFKSIYNFSDVPLSWKNKFVMKDSRNGILLEPIHTRIRLCDQNFYIYSINLFNSLPISVRNEKSFVTFMSLCQTFLLDIFNNL